MTSIEQLFHAGFTHVLIEEPLSGMELTVGVFGNTEPFVLPPSQTVSNKTILSLEEKFLPGQGTNLTPAPLPESILLQIQETVKKAYITAGCSGYARIDCFFQPADISPTRMDRVIVLEINTLPALTPATCLFHQAAEIGLVPVELLDLIIQLGYAQKVSDVHSFKNIFTPSSLFEKIR